MGKESGCVHCGIMVAGPFIHSNRLPLRSDFLWIIKSLCSCLEQFNRCAIMHRTRLVRSPPIGCSRRFFVVPSRGNFDQARSKQ